ncbi:hypothetical protein SAMN05216238_104302 [Lentibacillus persicus]|uniref:Uncharacterized protein n=1 Tax=Lentibacillus persicus TaxID=640948 RepID=A0A1I1VKR7_9BACI|nr:DUF5325 family protein [Lentibacillus persicus]SFD83365.1 hypothetical protein SAMN05216238_104302 [Lentibacillus persicus]
MKSLDVPMLLLASLVIFMFAFTGIAIAFRNIWLILLFILLGFAFMGLGIYLKRKRK